MENERKASQPKPELALKEGDVGLGLGWRAGARAGSGFGWCEVHMLHRKPCYTLLLIFLTPCSLQPLLTLGTM